MGLNLGQTLSSMGIIANRQRETEDAMLRQRQLELQTQELNQLQRMRADMARDAVNLASGAAPMQFAQTPGAQFGTPEVPQPQAPTRPVPPPPTGAVAPSQPAAPAPQAGLKPGQVPLPDGVQPSTAGAGRGTTIPMTQDEIRQGYNRTALVKAPAALLDVVQAPAAAGLNLIGQGAKGINYLFGTNLPEKQFSMTPFYDAWVRQPEQQLATGTKPMPKPEAGLDVPGAKPNAALLKKAQEYDATKTQYDPLIAQAAQANGIDPVVFKRLIGTESSFQPNAVSPRGEKFGLGIAQIAAVHGLPREDMLNPQTAIPFAAQLFSKYLAESGGDYQQAIMKYKGASSPSGKQAMSGPAATILAGIDPTKTQAPAKQTVVAAVQTGTPQDVATAVVESVKPATGGTMYGAAAIDPSARNPVIQQTLQLRQVLQNQVNTYARYGRGDLALETAAKIQAIDLGLYKSQADIGLYEGATTGNFSRAMSVLSTFTGAPHQVLQRSDGKGFDLYINGKVSKAGLSGDQIEMLVRTQVDSEYRKQLASVQSERGKKRFETDEAIRQETSKQVLQTAREVQLEIVKGNTEVAKKKLEMAGFKATATGSGDGKVTYSNGLGDFFVVDTANNQIEVNGVKLDVGPQAKRAAGIDARSIWSSVNAPKQ